MITIISTIAFSVIIFLLVVKLIIKKNIKKSYEKFLLTGNIKKAEQMGKLYYLYVSKKPKHSHKIINIDEKILDDFRAFNMVG